MKPLICCYLFCLFVLVLSHLNTLIFENQCCCNVAFIQLNSFVSSVTEKKTLSNVIYFGPECGNEGGRSFALLIEQMRCAVDSFALVGGAHVARARRQVDAPAVLAVLALDIGDA